MVNLGWPLSPLLLGGSYVDLLCLTSDTSDLLRDLSNHLLMDSLFFMSVKLFDSGCELGFLVLLQNELGTNQMLQR